MHGDTKSKSSPKPVSPKSVSAYSKKSVPVPSEFEQEYLNTAAVLYRLAKSIHDKAVVHAQRMNDQAMDDKGDLENMVDLAFLMRKTAELLDDSRKIFGRVESNLVDTIGHTWLVRCSADPIRGQLATGSPDCTDVPKLPSKTKDPHWYGECMEALGVPVDLVELGVVQLHFNGLKALSQHLAASGKSMPEPLKRAGAYPMYSLTLRGRSGNPLGI